MCGGRGGDVRLTGWRDWESAGQKGHPHRREVEFIALDCSSQAWVCIKFPGGLVKMHVAEPHTLSF